MGNSDPMKSPFTVTIEIKTMPQGLLIDPCGIVFLWEFFCGTPLRGTLSHTLPTPFVKGVGSLKLSEKKIGVCVAKAP